MTVLQWILALAVAGWERLTRRWSLATAGAASPAGPPSGGSGSGDGRIVPEGQPGRRAENLVLVLLAIATGFAIAFVVVYALFTPAGLPNELLGICLGLSLISIGAALTIVAKRLVVTEELEDDYPQPHPEQQAELLQIVHESGSRITRKRLLLAAGGVTGGALTLASLTPAVSIGPLFNTGPLDRTPWRRGIRLVDEQGRPLLATQVALESFHTAFPEGANPELIGSSIVVTRLDPAKLRLPAGRSTWAPEGILAYSKICTHAGCAVALFRKPTFPVVEPQPAFVCPCHYSTFDPYTGATVIFGPAGRPLPQLPLEIDSAGHLRAAGNFSGRVGPAWWGVRERPT